MGAIYHCCNGFDSNWMYAEIDEKLQGTQDLSNSFAGIKNKLKNANKDLTYQHISAPEKVQYGFTFNK